MGRRAAGVAIARIVAAFCERPGSWSQAELCEYVDLRPRQLRKHMLELRDAGLPVTREREDGGSPVYWTMWIRLRASAPHRVKRRR